jgi:WD40 repeat protein
VIASFSPHASGVRLVTASPANDSFITISNDREVKAWAIDPKNAQPTPIRSWMLPVSANAAAYTPDGKHVVTGNSDGTAYVLELP